MSNIATTSLGSYQEQVTTCLSKLDGDSVVSRIWDKDPSLWSKTDEEAQAVANRLGWLDAPEKARDRLQDYRSFGAQVRDAEFRHVVLMGMGGSSLCPEVLRRTFPSATGYPRLTVLDSTDPTTIKTLDQSLTLEDTLFVVSTKSGTTLETLSFYRYFWQRVNHTRGGEPGVSFVAVTDPGTPLAAEAKKEKFRRIFDGIPSVGGRYSALTAFGLVPAALQGLDLDRLISSSERMRDRCKTEGPENPGLNLGATLGELARAGRDKVTIVVDPEIGSLGLWLEQLLAESLGKEGKGLIPIVDEPLGSTEFYGDDRVFVYLSIGEGKPSILDHLSTLENQGHPVLRLPLRDLYDLGGEFFRWEFATAVAAVVLGVNAFDEPNVSESKQNTSRVLDSFVKEKDFPPEDILASGEGLSILGASGAGAGDRPGSESRDVGEILTAWLQRLDPEQYLAIQAFVPVDDAVETSLLALRVQLRDRCRVATTLGLGPRYLHSTGQLHKGGPKIGAFLQISMENEDELSIPGEQFGFAALIRAQAIGDAQSLGSRDLPLIRIRVSNGGEISAIGNWIGRTG